MGINNGFAIQYGRHKKVTSNTLVNILYPITFKDYPSLSAICMSQSVTGIIYVTNCTLASHNLYFASSGSYETWCYWIALGKV